MSAIPSTPASAPAGQGFPRALVLASIVLASLFLLVVLGTRSTFFGDTAEYVGEIGAVLQGQAPFTSLLDFGHLIWRPLGALLTHPSGADLKSTQQEIAMNLIHINLVASAVCAVAMLTLIRFVRGIGIVPTAISVAAFLATNGLVVLSRSGTAWLPGLACILVACCCALQATRRNSVWLAMCAAVLSAASVLFWIPYVLSTITVASACLLAWDEGHPSKRLIESSVRILPLAGLITILAFAVAVCARHIGTSGEFIAWVRSAAHGEGRDRQLVRMFFGLPRSFFIMGDDGVLWKQFLFHDPYAGVGLREVLRASAWKIALFYSVAAIATLELIRQPRARGILLWASAGIIPTLALAVLFEAGSVERYLALYPATFVVFAWLMSQRSTYVASRAVIAFFCFVLIVNNLWENAKPRVDAHRARSLARVEPVLAAGQARGDAVTIYTLNIRDDLTTLYDPNDTALPSAPKLGFLIPSLAGEIANWRGLFAQNALTTWSRGGEIWVSKRAWANRPLREWLWVEGDDRRVHWKDIRAIVFRFDVDSDVGGSDGFFRIANTAANREKALELTSEHSSDSQL